MMAAPDPYAGIATPADPYAGIAAAPVSPSVYSETSVVPANARVVPLAYPAAMHSASPQTARIPSPAQNPVTAPWAAPDRRAPYGVGGLVAHDVGAPTPMGTDVAQSILPGLDQGVASLLGAGGDAQHLARNLIDGGAKAFGSWTGWYSPQDYDRLMNTELFTGRPAVQDPIAQAAMHLPTSADINTGIQSIVGPYYRPQTTPGKVVQSIAELVPSTATGGETTLAKLAPAVLGGTLGELGGEATQGTELEPWVRTAGTLVGGLGAAYATQPATVARMLAQGGRGLTQSQIDLAQALMQHGEGMGVPITSAEAVQQVTGGAFPGLTRLQRVAEGTREGQSIYGPAMAQRPQQLADALRSTVLDPLSPTTIAPSAIGLDAQQGSQAVLDTAREAVNAQARPFYDRLGGQVVDGPAGGYSHAPQYSGAPGQFIPDDQFGPLASSPAYREALAQVRGDPMLNAGVETLPDNDLQVVDRTVKQLDRNAQGYAQTATNPGGNNFKAAQAANARAQADDLAAAVSPDWRAARDIVRGGHEVLLDPLSVGPIGQMARTTDVGAQTAALYPRAPLEGAASETAQALRALGRVNDGEFSAIPGDLTRQHLANSWNEASRGVTPDQWVGARWFKNTLGNPEQKAVTLAGVGEVGGPDLADALSRFGDVAQATGYRARQGSATAFNLEDLADMEHGGPAGSVIKGVLDPLKVPEMARDAFLRWQMGRNSEALANAFLAGTPEDRADLLSQALKSHPTTLPGWGTKLFLYDNPVMPGRSKEGDHAP